MGCRTAERLTVILLTNHSDRLVDHLAIDIAGMYVRSLRRPEAAVDPDPETTQKLRSVIAGLQENRYDPVEFTPTMQLFLGTATGRAYWQWIAAHGRLTSLVFSDLETRETVKVLRYRAVLGGNPYWVSVAFAADGKIAQMYWS